MLHYAETLFEQIWLIRNKIRLGSEAPNWDAFACAVNRLNQQYWQAATHRENSRKKHSCHTSWTPPKLGHFKFTFDVSLFDNHVTYVVVMRNHLGDVIGLGLIIFSPVILFVQRWKWLAKPFPLQKT